MDNLCKSGFPKEINSLPDFLIELQKRGADKKMIDIHYNSEPNTGNLHQFMWDAISQGYIDQSQSFISNTTDTQFKVKLRLSAITYLQSREDARSSAKRERINLVVSFIVLLVTLVGVAFTIISYCKTCTH